MGSVALTPPLECIFDVVVVGGGPTGLFLSLLARQAGLSVVVLDAKPGPLEAGRADALNARTQQYFEVAGVLDELTEQGLKCTTNSTYSNGQWISRRDTWYTTLQHCHNKYQLMIGQPAIERVLAAHAQALGVEVHYNTRVVSITEDTMLLGSRGGVTVTTTTTTSSNAQSSFKGLFAVGADGSRSLVRTSTGIDFVVSNQQACSSADDNDSAALPKSMVWGVMDAVVATDFPQCAEIVSFEKGGQARVQWIPRERGLARLYACMGEGKGQKVTLEETMACVREHLAPHWIEFREIEWFSSVEVKEKIAASLVTKQGRGRIFLIGDAAHVHSFRGGQGLNTGLADAFALAWRLAALVEVDRMDDGILRSKKARILAQSFDLERRAVANKILELSAGLARDARRSAAEYLARVEQNSGYITGMGVSYADVDSKLVEGSGQDPWRGGCRCPELYLRRPGSETTVRLYELVQYGQWAIITVLGAEEALGNDGDGTKSVARLCLMDRLSAVMENFDGTDGDNGMEFDLESDLGGEVVIVRPDLYIGFVGDRAGAEQYAHKVL